MRIVTNTIPLLSQLTGIGNYTWQICRAMQKLAPDHDYRYYYGYYSSRLFRAGQDGGGIAGIKDSLKNIPGLGRSLRLLKGVGALVPEKTADVYFEPNYIPLPIKARKTVVTVPDFSPFLYPEWHKEEVVAYITGQFRKQIQRADLIIAISDFIRDTAINEFGFAPERVRTIHLGFDAAVFRPLPVAVLTSLRGKYPLPERFLLYVGSIEPRKNLMRLLQAYRQLSATVRSEVKLVLAGFHGWDNADVMELLASLRDDVSYLGYIPEPDLAGLYNLAEAFVYPALYEGFGLPPLEAMACGCPVVVSGVASLPEVCGGAALYVDPTDAEQMTGALEGLLADATAGAELRAKGLERAQQFSWERSAREHLVVFEM